MLGVVETKSLHNNQNKSLAGPKTREYEHFEIKKHLKDGVIEHSVSLWDASVLFAPKKDGRIRFCVNYRTINPMKVKGSFHLPVMDECIDALGDANDFTTLDRYNGYWKVRSHLRIFIKPHSSAMSLRIVTKECPLV